MSVSGIGTGLGQGAFDLFRQKCTKPTESTEGLGEVTQSRTVRQDMDKVLGLAMIRDDSSRISYGMVAQYAQESTAEDPVIKVKSNAGGKDETYFIHIKDVDPSNATQMEMFALCSYADDQGIGKTGMGSYSFLRNMADNASMNGYCEGLAGKDKFLNTKLDWTDLTKSMRDDYSGAGVMDQYQAAGQLLQMLEHFSGMAAGKSAADPQGSGDKNTEDSNSDLNEKMIKHRTGNRDLMMAKLGGKVQMGFPYEIMAQDGGNTIEYNGVVYNGDSKNHSLNLGDTSNPDNTLVVSLEGGGCLKVNRNKLGDLAKSIGMFSPEDQRRIMEAILKDKMVQERKMQLEEDENSLGESAEKVLDKSAEQAQGEQSAEQSVSSEQYGQEYGSSLKQVMDNNKYGNNIEQALLGNGEEKNTEQSLYSFEAGAAVVRSRAENEKASERLDNWYQELFKGTAPGVKEAWEAAGQIVGADGSGLDREGKLGHITQIVIDRLFGDIPGAGGVLGDTVESARAYAEHAIESLDEELARNNEPNQRAEEAARRERQFYQEFVKQLDMMSTAF